MPVHEWVEQWFKGAPDEEAILESVKMSWGICLHRNKAAFDHVVENLSRITNTNNNMNSAYSKPINCDYFARNNLEINQEHSSIDSYFAVTNNVHWPTDPIFARFLIDGAWLKHSAKAGAAWIGWISNCSRSQSMF
ncbi:hypothetical protein LOK49_LG05G00689 [Camellia lanceoleosa]|uniref:Uncharacterized protein n=1 Tax=Camellia lanceoleosa TaxID=1840588 RepID=A0ACC0HJG8_9ERIC|nr:hypothetical protein LOK49_LG05G00689 [Camellia lanceoleosa]